MQELEKIIEKMKEIKDGNRKEKLYAKAGNSSFCATFMKLCDA